MYEEFRNRVFRQGAYMGEIMRNQSNVIVNATWMNSVSTYPVMVHSVNTNLPPVYTSLDDYDEPLYAHFETKSIYTAGSNEPAYYLTFQPGAISEHPEIKIGSYVNIPSVDGICQYWLIVHLDDDNELIRTQILKTSWTLKWTYNNKIYNALCVVRNGASENIGIETAGQLSTVDSDMFIWIPTNVDTQTIGYDTRFIISDTGRNPPLVWKSSRILDVGPIGITRLSLTQDLFNPSTDNATLGIANYYGSEFIPISSNTIPTTQDILISYTGTKPQIKVGGSSKTFTAMLPDDNNSDIMWSISDGTNTYGESSYDNGTHTYNDYTVTTTDRTLVLKVARNYNLVGKVLTIKAHCDNNDEGTVEVEVVS